MKALLNRFCNYFNRHSNDNENQSIVESAPPVIIEKEDKKLEILNDGWGHSRSRSEKMSLDVDGNALPWYTYPAIEYLRQLDFSSSRIFEWGSGNSSIYWSQRCKSVISIEWNIDWYKKVSLHQAENMELIHIGTDPDYAHAIDGKGEFDVIVIDGRERHACAVAALSHLSDGGIIILDNADWYVRASSFLREQGMVQVDFSGFGPINDYTWSTSIYFRGDMKVQPKSKRFPAPATGALDVIAEEDRDFWNE